MKARLTKLAAITVSVTAAVMLAGIGIAHADFTNQNICDNQTRVNCLWLDLSGTGDVYTKDEHTAWATEHWDLQANAVCTDPTTGQPTSQVQYRPNYNVFCPFTDHGIDNNLQGAEIVRISQPTDIDDAAIAAQDNGSVTGSLGSGTKIQWVWFTGDADTGFKYLVSVEVTNFENNGGTYELSETAIDQPAITTNACSKPQCEWQKV